MYWHLTIFDVLLFNLKATKGGAAAADDDLNDGIMLTDEQKQVKTRVMAGENIFLTGTFFLPPFLLPPFIHNYIHLFLSSFSHSFSHFLRPLLPVPFFFPQAGQARARVS